MAIKDSKGIWQIPALEIDEIVIKTTPEGIKTVRLEGCFLPIKTGDLANFISDFPQLQGLWLCIHSEKFGPIHFHRPSSPKPGS